MAYNTPGVYVEEVSLFPPSVAQVETAIPAFIGYTEKATDKGDSLRGVPKRISSMPEFRELYGGPPPITDGSIEVELNADNGVEATSVTGARYFLFDSIRLFYDNGGGDCYVISVGSYSDTPEPGNGTKGISWGIKKLAKEDEPTMIVFPDAAGLTFQQLSDMQKAALDQCVTLQDRVGVFDLKENATGDPNWEEGKDKFRDLIGTGGLKYGAAYTPWLRTSYARQDIRFRHLDLLKGGASVQLSDLASDDDPDGIQQLITNLGIAAKDVSILNKAPADFRSGAASIPARYEALAAALKADPKKDTFDPVVELLRDLALRVNEWVASTDANKKLSDGLGATVKGRIQGDLAGPIGTLVKLHKAAAAAAAGLATAVGTTYNALAYPGSSWGFTAASDLPGADNSLVAGANPAERVATALPNLQAIFDALYKVVSRSIENGKEAETDTEKALKQLFGTYAKIVGSVAQSLTRIPPSGAIAGVYAKVDRQRGVWKAPANVSLNGVAGLSYQIDNNEQGRLNIDVNAGKSINAIRKFNGKGILVWGARTLAGNDNEWRYVSVRRFYNMVEESTKKSTGWAVFESNDAATWVRVRGMIENYLTGLWRDGALMGSKPEQAFFVNVGLGTTMTAIDVLEGRMIVEIGMAVVRPAEFIILRFMHKMPEA